MSACIVAVLGTVRSDADVEAITGTMRGNQESLPEGQRVLIIEADSTDPTLGNVLGNNRPDIFTGLTGTTVTIDDATGIIQHSEEHGVDYITTPRFHDGAQVYHQRYLQTIEALAPMYDWIVLLIGNNTDLFNHIVPDL